jgi:hypothetical protein
LPHINMANFGSGMQFTKPENAIKRAEGIVLHTQ